MMINDEELSLPDNISVRDFENPAVMPVLTGPCDRCSARAKARVVRRKDGVVVDELVFCGHHLNKYAEPLTEQGFTVS